MEKSIALSQEPHSLHTIVATLDIKTTFPFLDTDDALKCEP